MASAVIGALRVDLGLNTAAFTTGLQGAQSKLAGFGALARKAILPAVAAATAAAAGMAVAVKGTINAADEMSKSAQKFGVPIEELSRLKYAADLSDVSLEGLGTSLGRLSKNMVAAAQDGASPIAEAFRNLGVEATNADGTLRSSTDVLGQMADAFASMEDGPAKTAAAMTLMGKSGQEMIPLLNGGSEALAQMAAEADKFGQVFTADMGQEAEQFNDNITRLQGAFGNLAADLTQKLLPYLAQFTDWLVENGPRLADVVVGFVKLGAAVVDFAGKMIEAVRATIQFGKETVQAVRDAAAGIEAAVADLRDRFVQLGKDIMAGLWAGLKAGAGEIISWVGDFATGLWEKARAAVGAKSPAKKFIDLGADILQGLLVGLQSNQGPVNTEMTNFASGLGGTFATGFNTGIGGLLDDLISKVGDRIGAAVKGAGKNLGLSDTAASGLGAGVGMGIGSAAVGLMNENAQQVGAGIGGAAGAVLGSFIPGIGTALGSILGSAAGGALASIGGSKFARIKGTAFEGTTYAAAVKTDNDRKVDRKDLEPEGQLAFQGVKALLGDFQAELAEFVKATGGTVRSGVSLVVDQTKALKAITGALTEGEIGGLTSSGGKEAGERIAAKVAEIMAIAGEIVKRAEPPLTQAQVLWRAAQEKFSAANVAILKDLGFSVKQISGVQQTIRSGIRSGFEQEILEGLVQTGRASRVEIGKWRKVELDALEERRVQAVATARELGTSTAVVESYYRAQRNEIQDQFKDLLDGLVKSTSGAAAAAARLAERLKANQGNLSDLEAKRSEVLQELTKRSEEALRAEESLRDARLSLSTGALNPGGPLDQFKALQGQFAAAIKGALGGDAGAAGQAAGLASNLLEAGRSVFASGSGYADLFKEVNTQLLAAQQDFDKRAESISQVLDQKTYKETAERTTKALLSAFERLNASVEKMDHRIELQTRQLQLTQQRQSVAR